MDENGSDQGRWRGRRRRMGLLLLQFGLQLGVFGRLGVLGQVGHTVLNPEDVDQLLAKGASDGARHGEAMSASLHCLVDARGGGKARRGEGGEYSRLRAATVGLPVTVELLIGRGHGDVVHCAGRRARECVVWWCARGGRDDSHVNGCWTSRC